jgi:acyl dehydratase
MATHGERAHQLYLDAVRSSEGSGDWFEIDQARIDAFADVTEDHQVIHVDPEACTTLSPWGVPVAHGFLTLSLLTKLTASVPTPPERLEGIVMGVNYGFEKVRFISPVKVGSKVRASSVLAAVQAIHEVVVLVRDAGSATGVSWITRVGADGPVASR